MHISLGGGGPGDYPGDEIPGRSKAKSVVLQKRCG